MFFRWLALRVDLLKVLGQTRLAVPNNHHHPPPNLAEVMYRQIELLNLLVQAQQNQYRQQPRGGHDDLNSQVASYQDFLSTQPPFFSKAEEPLDVDA
jgi:hypothetical protein